MDAMRDPETVVRLLALVGREPELSQREMARRLGVSLGKVNYVLRALVSRGLVKTERFLNSRNKWAYRYLLTPRGLKEKAKITREFIRRKLAEYERLMEE